MKNEQPLTRITIGQSDWIWDEKSQGYRKAYVERIGPVVQKLKDVVPGEIHNKTRVPKDHGKHDKVVPRSIEAHFYYSDKYRRDLDGALSTTLDCLVKAGAIPDDNRFVVPEIFVKGHDCEDGEDRVEVTIRIL